MKLFRRHWYNIGGILALFCIAGLVSFWDDFQTLQRLLFMNFIALLIHQFEEYGLPGGEPSIMNIVLQNSNQPTNFPLNQNSAMVTNVFVAWTFYLLPVFFPNLIWLALAPTLFGFGQFLVHGIQTPKKLGEFYNSGLGAVLLLHIPIGIYILYYILSNHLATWLDWVLGIVYLFVFMFFGVLKLTYTWLANKNSKYHFAEEEMKRFNVQEKLNKRNLAS